MHLVMLFFDQSIGEIRHNVVWSCLWPWVMRHFTAKSLRKEVQYPVILEDISVLKEETKCLKIIDLKLLNFNWLDLLQNFIYHRQKQENSCFVIFKPNIIKLIKHNYSLALPISPWETLYRLSSLACQTRLKQHIQYNKSCF